jgi:hypothetical protein
LIAHQYAATFPFLRYEGTPSHFKCFSCLVFIEILLDEENECRAIAFFTILSG